MSDIPDETKKWWTTQEAAAFLGLKPETLKRRRQLGKPPRFYRVLGRQIRYDPADVRALVEEERPSS